MRTGSLSSKFLIFTVLVLGFVSELNADNPTQQQAGKRHPAAADRSPSGAEAQSPGGGIGTPEGVPFHKGWSGSSVLLMAVAQLPRRIPQQQREEDEARAKMEKDQAKKFNEERFENLKRDTDKLLKLSTELKAYVDKSSKDTLSLDVVKKAEEIEKLAKSVKEKMKGSY